MTRLVQSVGINDRSRPTKIEGRNTKEYTLWHDMLKRCYSIIYQEKYPTYIGCTISDNFKLYSYFFDWCSNQIGFGNIGYCLDKDLLYKGNKTYNENSCVFLPKDLNMLLVKSNATRGLYPIGVSKEGNRFKVQCRVSGKNNYLGLFDTPELAFNAYKNFKEAHIKELAEKYKDTIDSRAYQALLNYEVSIDD